MDKNILERQLCDDLSAIISKHQAWLDGRTFQREAMRVAEAYFEQRDLDPLPLWLKRLITKDCKT